MIISGDVEKIIFRNEDNGYTVVDLRSSGDYVTAVGVFPEIYEGMRLERLLFSALAVRLIQWFTRQRQTHL